MQNATKIWITKAGKCYLCHNKSNIPERALRNMMKIIEARKCCSFGMTFLAKQTFSVELSALLLHV